MIMWMANMGFLAYEPDIVSKLGCFRCSSYDVSYVLSLGRFFNLPTRMLLSFFLWLGRAVNGPEILPLIIIIQSILSSPLAL